MLVPVRAAVLQFPSASLMPGDKFCWARARLASRSDWSNSEWAALFLFQFSWKFTLGPFHMLRIYQSLEKDPLCFDSSFPHSGLFQSSFQEPGWRSQGWQFWVQISLHASSSWSLVQGSSEPQFTLGVIPRVTFILVAQICLGTVSFRLRFFWLDTFYNYSR